MANKALTIGLVVLLAILMLVSMPAPSVLAQSVPDSLFIVDMTGMNASYLIIGMGNVSDSRLIINTSVTVIELTGIHIYPISCDFGLLRPGDIKATDEVFEIYNASNATVDVTIAVAGDWMGVHNWTHSDDCIPGVDTAGLIAIVEDGSGHESVIVRKTEPYNYLATDLAPGETRQLSLEIYAPTTFTEYSQKRNTIFITVEEA